MTMSAMGGADSPPGGAATAWGATLVGVLALTAFAFRLGLHARASFASSPLVGVYVAAAAYVVSVVPVTYRLANDSHLILMIQTMLLMAAAPALLVSAIDRSAPPASLPISMIRVLLPLAAAGYVAARYFWHLPSAHQAAMGSVSVTQLRMITEAAAGALFWAAVLGDRRPTLDRPRATAAMAVAGLSGLLGLALLIGSSPMFAMPTGFHLFGLSEVWEQRMAGL